MKKIYIIYSSYEISDEIMAKIKLLYNNVYLIPINSKILFLKKIVRKIIYSFDSLYFCIPIIHKNLNSIEDGNIILNFSNSNKVLNKYLFKKFKNSKRIFYCWDLSCFESINKLKKYYNQIWSFDYHKSKQYNLNFYPQFYWKENIHKNIVIKEEIFFIGIDKGRLSILIKLKEKLNDKIIIYVLPDKHKKYTIQEKKYLKKSMLTYKEIENKILEAKCILELNQKGQEGLTLRAMESLFFNKKLITNNKRIKEYNFYNKNNILIIDENKINYDEIIKFLNKPQITITDEIKEKYKVNNWFKALISSIE